MTVPSAAAAAILLNGPRVWRFRFTRIVDGVIEEAPEDVVSCVVKDNNLADNSKRTCSVALSPDSAFDYLHNSLRCYAALRLTSTTWEEWPLGTFLLSAPDRAVDHPSSPVTIEGYDYLSKWVGATTTDRYTPTFGTSFGAIINEASLAVLGKIEVNIPGELYTTVPTAHLQWDPGTPWLRVVNDCLASCNCRPLAVDAYGVAYSEVYTDPAEGPVIWTYTRDDESLIVRGSSRVELDLLDVPNQWVGIVSDPAVEPPLRSVYTNDDAGSLTSTVSRGRTITRVLTSDEVGLPVTQNDLDLIVQRFALNQRNQYLHVNFETMLMPFHDTGSVVDLDFGEGVQRFREVSWELDMKAGGRMKHDVRRVVQVV